MCRRQIEYASTEDGLSPGRGYRSLWNIRYATQDREAGMKLGLYLRNEGMEPLSVWVDDQHAIFRAGLVAAIRGEGHHVVGESSSLALADVPSHCDVVVYEASSDAQISEATKLSQPSVAIVASGDIALASAAVQRGTSGLLVRQELTPRRLSSAINTAHDGSWSGPSDLTERLMQGGEGSSDRSGLLTQREARVLELIAAGMSTQEIASEMAYSSRTIKNQVQSILVKLNCRNRAHAVGVAVREGWI